LYANNPSFKFETLPALLTVSTGQSRPEAARGHRPLCRSMNAPRRDSSFLAQPRPQWATPPQNQWSELVVNLVMAASACIVATSLRNGPWGFGSRSRE
jgi:hypothetical protein